MEDKRPESMKRIKTKELADAFIEEQVALLRKQIGDKKVLLALSGGVDSSVVAALLIKAVGKQLVCVHVNHGLLRKGEPEQVIRVFKEEMDANLVYVDAVEWIASWINWPAQLILSRNARSSARSSSEFSKKKQESSKASNFSRKAPSTPTSLKAQA